MSNAQNVTIVDFGKDQRDHVRMFAQLTGICEAHEADILRDPVKHMKKASEKIANLKNKIRAVRDAGMKWRVPSLVNMRDEIKGPSISDTLVVCRREWEALNAMRDILEQPEDWPS